jgi:hypothetical protein
MSIALNLIGENCQYDTRDYEFIKESETSGALKLYISRVLSLKRIVVIVIIVSILFMSLVSRLMSLMKTM